jgi:hypothetical protein
LINSGVLDARRFGKRTYITAQSLETFVASLPQAVTPTIAKAGRRIDRMKQAGGEPGAAE